MQLTMQLTSKGYPDQQLTFAEQVLIVGKGLGGGGMIDVGSESIAGCS